MWYAAGRGCAGASTWSTPTRLASAGSSTYHRSSPTRKSTSSMRSPSSASSSDPAMTRSHGCRARVPLQPRSQHGDLGILLGRAVAVLDQPPDVTQASQRPPRADEFAVDVGAVAGYDVAEMLRVSERKGGEVE